MGPPDRRIWLGLPGRNHRGRQYDVRDLPDILHAQRRHYRLARHYGRRTTADAFAEAAHITAFWARHGLHDDRRKPLIRAFLGHNPLTGRRPSGDPITPVVTYPETVDLARVLAMPGWRHPTGRCLMTKRPGSRPQLSPDYATWQKHAGSHLLRSAPAAAG
jgi:hypothetical protein